MSKNESVSKKENLSQKLRVILQVGGKGKDEMEDFCTENEQWKEVGLTNTYIYL